MILNTGCACISLYLILNLFNNDCCKCQLYRKNQIKTAFFLKRKYLGSESSFDMALIEPTNFEKKCFFIFNQLALCPNCKYRKIFIYLNYSLLTVFKLLGLTQYKGTI